MNSRLTTVACLAAILGLSFAAGSARADPVPWSYSWGAPSTSIASQSGSSAVNLLPLSGTAAGNSTVVAANLVTSSSSTGPDAFVNAGYGLTMSLHDLSNSQSAKLSFTGVFNGSASMTSAQVMNTFTGMQTQTVTLGLDQFTVTIGPFLPPGAPGSGGFGGMGASVTVQTQSDSTGFPTSGPPSHAPEPSSLLLAALGGSALVALRFRRKRTEPIPA